MGVGGGGGGGGGRRWQVQARAGRKDAHTHTLTHTHNSVDDLSDRVVQPLETTRTKKKRHPHRSALSEHNRSSPTIQ